MIYNLPIYFALFGGIQCWSANDPSGSQNVLLQEKGKAVPNLTLELSEKFGNHSSTDMQIDMSLDTPDFRTPSHEDSVLYKRISDEQTKNMNETTMVIYACCLLIICLIIIFAIKCIFYISKPFIRMGNLQNSLDPVPIVYFTVDDQHCQIIPVSTNARENVTRNNRSSRNAPSNRTPIVHYCPHLVGRSGMANENSRVINFSRRPCNRDRLSNPSNFTSIVTLPVRLDSPPPPYSSVELTTRDDNSQQQEAV